MQMLDVLVRGLDGVHMSEISLGTLPKDALTSIFRFCGQEELQASCFVCKRFQYVIFADFILKEKVRTFVFRESGKVAVLKAGTQKFHELAVPRGQSRVFATISMVHSGDVVQRLSSHNCVGVGKRGASSTLSQFPLIYFADGDVWSYGDHAKYDKG
jgi:hypothetical protein